MIHDLTTNGFFRGGKKITQDEFQSAKAFFIETCKLAVMVRDKEITIDNVPARFAEKVSETVKIMQQPSKEKARLEAEWEREI